VIVVVTGGRDYRADRRIYEELDAVASKGPPVRFLIHGACRGTDMLAGNWARDREIDEVRMPARWKQSIDAGPERNRRMLKFAAELSEPGERVMLLAFPGGLGTASCVREAERLGIEVRRVKP